MIDNYNLRLTFRNEYVKSIICIGEYCFPISMSESYLSIFIDDAVAVKCVTLTLNTYFTHAIYTHESFGLASRAINAEENGLVTLKLRLVHLRAVGS